MCTISPTDNETDTFDNTDIRPSTSSTPSPASSQGLYVSLTSSSSPSYKTPPLWKVYSALLCAQLSWSGFHVLSKSLYDSNSIITHWTLPTFRTLLVLPMFIVYSAYHDTCFYVITPRQHLWMIVEGFLGNFISQQAFNLGDDLSSATLAGSLQPSIPVMTTIMAVALKKEKGNWSQVIGIILSVLGAVVITVFGIGESNGQAVNERDTLLGASCFLLQCFCTAIYILLQKPLFDQGMHVNTFTFYLFLYGGVMHIILGGFFLPYTPWNNFSWTIIPSILYVSCIATFLAFSMFCYAVKWLPASISSLGICMQTLFSPLLGFLLLGESMTVLGLFGGILIISGIVTVVYSKEKQKKCVALTDMGSEMSAVQMTKEDPMAYHLDPQESDVMSLEHFINGNVLGDCEPNSFTEPDEAEWDDSDGAVTDEPDGL